MNQSTFDFPQSLAEKYRPRKIEDFAGIPKAKKLCANLVQNPRDLNLLFVGASGTGKTTLALALAEMMPAELHHTPSQNCNVAEIQRVRQTCQYVPMSGFKRHLWLIDEADQMSAQAQVALLSVLDSTNHPPNTIIIFTCNATDRLEPRFLSRCLVLEFSNYGISTEAIALLERVWNSEAPKDVSRPNFARIVKENCGNIRACLMSLETELLCV